MNVFKPYNPVQTISIIFGLVFEKKMVLFKNKNGFNEKGPEN